MLEPKLYGMCTCQLMGAYFESLPVSILAGVISKLNVAQWDVETLHNVLEEERKALDVKQKFYMMALRHALTGMKVCFSRSFRTHDSDCLPRLAPRWRPCCTS